MHIPTVRPSNSLSQCLLSIFVHFGNITYDAVMHSDTNFCNLDDFCQ